MFGMAQQFFIRGGNGFTAAIVTGRRRIGKTMYSLWTVYQIEKKRGFGDKWAWDTALNSIVFSMDDLIKKIELRTHNNREDFLIWDDAGVYGAGMMYQYNMDNAIILKALMDVIGTRVRLLMLTCPDAEGLMKFLRRYSDYLVIVDLPKKRPHVAYDRDATVLQPYLAKNYVKKWGIGWVDEVNIKIPDDVYNKYIEIRDNYAQHILGELMDNGRRRKKGNKLVRQADLQPDVATAFIQGLEPADRQPE